MKRESIIYCSLLVSYYILALTVTGSNLPPNETEYFGESYATPVSANSNSSEINNSTSDPLFERSDDGLFSEFNMTGNNSLAYQSFLAADDERSVTPSFLNVTYAAFRPDPGTFQIPYTGLSRYHMTPAVSNLFGLNETTYGMLVTEVEPGSPAAQVGIKGGNVTTSVAGETVKVGGDIILEIDSNSSLVRNDDAFLNYLRNEKGVGENITFTILRDGQTKEIDMTIGAVPTFLWYDNRDEGIRMKFPSDWRVDESNLSKQDIVKFFAPERTKAHNATLPIAGTFVKVVPTTSSLDQTASAQQEGTPTTRTLDMFLTSVSDLPGYEIVFYDYSNEDRTLKILSVFTIKDGRIYRINFAVDPPRYNDYLPLAKEMIESFQFTK